MRLLLFFVLLLLTVTSLHCQKSPAPVIQSGEGRFLLGGASAEEVVERTISPEGRALEILNPNGQVTVKGTNESMARLTFHKYARGDNDTKSKSGLQNIDIEERGSDATYHYKIVHTSRANRTSVDVVAEVPNGTPLSLLLKNSDVLIENFSGSLTIDNRNGAITINASGGGVQAKTNNGPIHVSVAALVAGESVVLETNNGSIEVQLPAQLNAEIKAITSAGGIYATGLTFENIDFSETATGAQYEGRLGEGKSKIRASTDAGDIILKATSLLKEVPSIESDSPKPQAKDTTAEMNPQLPPLPIIPEVKQDSVLVKINDF